MDIRDDYIVYKVCHTVEDFQKTYEHLLSEGEKWGETAKDFIYFEMHGTSYVIMADKYVLHGIRCNKAEHDEYASDGCVRVG